jgi:hypothetical protein
MMSHGRADRLLFFPQVIVQVKALACELPCERGIPLSHFSVKEIAREAIKRGIVANISDATIWRWLSEDAIKPWQYRSWIFPRDAAFKEKASRVLDLYHGIWDGRPLDANEYIISADEKTSIQARIRTHATQSPKSAQCMRIEHEYTRGGALTYLAAWDVRRAKIFGRCETQNGIVPFGRLINQVMTQEPYCSAKRVFWIIDNGSSHRGESSIQRFRKTCPTMVPVHLPVHASWLNQVEIYFSIIQRKVLTPNYFSSLENLQSTIIQFQERYEQIAKPFQWKFTKDDLSKLLEKVSAQQNSLALCA